MSTPKSKKYAFETIQDPAMRYNFDLVSKQIDQLRNDYAKVNFVASQPTTDSTLISSVYPTFTDVPQLKQTIVTTGKPVLLALQPGVGDVQFQGNLIVQSIHTAQCVAYLRFYRDGKKLWETSFGYNDNAAAGALIRNSYQAASQFWTIDHDLPGTSHEYKCSASLLGAGSTLLFNFVRLTMLELNGNAAFIR